MNKLRKKLVTSFVIPVFVMFLMVSGVYSQEIKLEYKVPVKSIEYNLDSNAKSVFSLYGLEKLIVQEANTTFKYSKGNKSGEIPIRLDVTDQILINDGEPSKNTEKGKSVQLLLEKNGVVVKSSDTSVLENFQDLLISFPDKKVKKGSTWVNKVPMQLPDGKGGMIDTKAEIKCIVSSIKKFKGHKCVVIDTKLTIRPEKNDFTNMKAEATGKIYFDYKRGLILAVTNKLRLKLDVYKFYNKKKVLFTSLSLKMINKLKVK